VADGTGATDLVALAPETGAERFRLSAGGVFTAPIPWPGTGTVVGPERFLVASTHRLLAIAASDAKVEWQVDFSRRADGLPGGPGLSSPTLLGNLVVVGTADGFVHAFAAETGERRWAMALGRPIHGGIASDGRFVFFTAGSLLLACDANGRERWRQALGGDASLATPVVDRGVVYIANGTGGAVIALEAATGRRLWRTALGATVVNRPALARDHLIVGDLTNQLTVLRQADGAVVGQWSLGTGGGIYRSDPILAGDLIGVGSTSGLFHVFAGAPVAAEVPAEVPAAVAPLFAAPNPFRMTTTIQASGAGMDPNVALQIYDVRGRLVRELGPATAGGTGVEWDGRNAVGVRVGAGTYFARIAGSTHRAIKIERLP
jgi:outer membrane protein assembly factor BamB